MTLVAWASTPSPVPVSTSSRRTSRWCAGVLNPNNLDRFRFVWNRTGDRLFVEATLEGIINLWRVEVDPTTLAWRSAERLTTGGGSDVNSVLSQDETRIAYVQQSRLHFACGHFRSMLLTGGSRVRELLSLKREPGRQTSIFHATAVLPYTACSSRQ